MSDVHTDQLARLDPESLVVHREILKAVPGGFQTLPIPQRRLALNAALEQMGNIDTKPDNVLTEERTIPGPDGAPDIAVRIYRPTDVKGPIPAIYYIHGGGMVVGDLETGHPECNTMCAQLGALVVSVDYRLAPEHPYPAPVEDCYAGLRWMAANSDELGLDLDRIAIYGPSAGGGLAVATALVALDRKGPKLCYVMAIYPMLDDRNLTPSSHQITSVGVWDRAANIEAWGAYLAGQEADHYAAPARRQDVAGFPPTFIDVGTEDLFRDEDIAFASKLLAAGVPTELHISPGAFHGSEMMAPASPLNQRILSRRLGALGEKLAPKG